MKVDVTGLLIGSEVEVSIREDGDGEVEEDYYFYK